MSSKAALLTLLLLVGGLALSCGGGGEERRAQIAFISERDGNKELYVMNDDGSGLRRLTDTAVDEEYPSWSPDGERIAFVSTSGGPPFGFFVMNKDGSALVKLAETSILAIPPEGGWSPDGSRLALQLNVAGNWDVYVVNADGTALTNVTAIPGDDFQPAWTPDGSRIMFQSGQGDDVGMYTVNSDGTGRTQITDNGWLPSWSPDGARMTFLSNREGNVDVYVMSADASEMVNVTNGPGSDGPPSGIVWSPDGTRIAFPVEGEDAVDLHVAGADGAGLTALTTGLGIGESRIDQIVWSPDASRIGFAASIGHSMVPDEIFVVNTDGSGLANLTNTGTKQEGIVGWSRDGGRIFFVGQAGPAVPTTVSGVEISVFDFDIFMMNADGSGLTTLADSPEPEYQAVLSPTR